MQKTSELIVFTGKSESMTIRLIILSALYFWLCLPAGISISLSDSLIIFEEVFEGEEITELMIRNEFGDVRIASHLESDIELVVRIRFAEVDKKVIDDWVEALKMDSNLSDSGLELRLVADDAPSEWWKTAATAFYDRHAVITTHLLVPEWIALDIAQAEGKVILDKQYGPVRIDLESGVLQAGYLLGENSLTLSRSQAQMRFFRKGTVDLSHSELLIWSAPYLRLNASHSSVEVDQLGDLQSSRISNATFSNYTAQSANLTSYVSNIRFGTVDSLSVESVHDSVNVEKIGCFFQLEVEQSRIEVESIYCQKPPGHLYLNGKESDILMRVPSETSIDFDLKLSNSLFTWPDGSFGEEKGEGIQFSETWKPGAKNQLDFKARLERTTLNLQQGPQ
ncbi:MAG: hypothetical protein EA411_05755 [Saprospirales bacterium]|nr:MAG: hypothetical protein EA411_05755 [Saprospirales bacterium]